jgi:hypothetical protein
MGQRIALLSCYFGGWPDWADLFVESCRYNPTVDIYLISDCAAPRQGFPANVKVVSCDLDRFRELASERLALPVAISKAYKLIDFKPAWGIIFGDLTEGYDWWGFCDLDIILGDVRAFLTDELLAQYDVISCRREFLSGHFMLFRNTEPLRRLYERSRDYRQVFTSPQVFNFDECGHGLHHRLLRGESFAAVAAQGKVDSMMHVLSRAAEFRVHYETICGEQIFLLMDGTADRALRISWDRGKLVDLIADRELMYFHLQFLKLEQRVYLPHWPDIPAAFLLTRRGVFRAASPDLLGRIAGGLRRAGYFTLVRPIRVAPFVTSWWIRRLVRWFVHLRAQRQGS